MTIASAVTAESQGKQFFTPAFFLILTACTFLAMGWRTTVDYPTGMFDLYPLYYGAKAWIAGSNAYDFSTVAPQNDGIFSLYIVGNTYPLPAALYIVPFSLLPVKLAATLWIGFLTGAVLLSLRLSKLPLWWGFSMPILDGIRIEQYTIFVMAFQIIALWSWRERRPWILAISCALILTKPNHGLFFVIVLVLLARNWRQQIIVNAMVWGGSLLLDPNWPLEWLPTLAHYRAVTQQPILWAFALFAIPLLLIRDWPGAATILQFLTLPFPTASTYAVGAVPLTILDDPRSKWLTVLSYCWVIPALILGPAWATALTVLLPTVALAIWRWYEQRQIPYAKAAVKVEA